MLRILSFLTVAISPTLVLAAEGAERPLINPLLSEMIWSLVLFVLFFLALAVLVWPKILSALQARESKMKTDLEQAEASARDAAATLEQYKQQLADAQVEARKVIDQARADADRQAAEIKAKSEADNKQMQARNLAEIHAAKEAAIADIYNQTADLATQVASRILGREINAADQQQLITESLEQLRQSQN